MNSRAHAFIEGRVQGVCFRYYARERAGDLGLCGWVRNLPDGSVETLVEGESGGVDAYIDWCRTGPPSAIVRNIAVTMEQPTGEFEAFEVRHGW
jgi:acylphosphatase